jgi:hypothetical protein
MEHVEFSIVSKSFCVQLSLKISWHANICNRFDNMLFRYVCESHLVFNIACVSVLDMFLKHYLWASKG